MTGPLAWPGRPALAPHTLVTIGNFDGVHRGHVALLQRAAEQAAAQGVSRSP